MADPTKYVPSYSFSGWQASSPSRPLPADRVDNEFVLLMQSVGTLVDAVKDVRRSDGKLRNGSVGPDQLSPALNIGFTNRGTWAAGESYVAGDGVGYGQVFYTARTTHVAAAGNRPDLDPATWLQLFSQASLTLTDGAVTTAKLADGAATTVKIANDAVTNAKLANMAAGTIKGRASAGSGDAEDLTAAQVVTMIAGNLPVGLRNRLINSNGDVNRRAYASGTATTAANQYTIDRWRVVVLGQALAWTTTAGVRTFTAPAGGVEQVIEDIHLAPGIHTLSWTGTAMAQVDGAAVPNGGEVTIAGGANVTVRMSAGTFAGVQFEQGTERTSVERRPLSLEQMLCERYFRLVRSSFNGDVGAGNYVDVREFDEMRSVPNATLVAQGNVANGNFYPRALQSASSTHAVFFAQAITATSSAGWSDMWALNSEL